jgi:hypothetical protein
MWTIPVQLSTGTSSGTCWIPEPFDATVLVNAVVARTLEHLRSDEAWDVKKRVFGDINSRNISEREGTLAKMFRIHASPKFNKIRVSGSL